MSYRLSTTLLVLLSASATGFGCADSGTTSDNNEIFGAYDSGIPTGGFDAGQPTGGGGSNTPTTGQDSGALVTPVNPGSPLDASAGKPEAGSITFITPDSGTSSDSGSTSDAETSSDGGDGAHGACLDGITDYENEGPFKYDMKTSGNVKFWVPAVPAGCKVPVVHLANGTTASCSDYQGALERLASHGFLTACYEDTDTGAGEFGIQALDLDPVVSLEAARRQGRLHVLQGHDERRQVAEAARAERQGLRVAKCERSVSRRRT